MRRILLIEDGPEVQLIVKGAIGRLFSLTVAPTLLNAMDLIKEAKFDLFVIDIMLPDGDGFHLCAYIRNSDKNRDTPVIFLTSKSEIKDKLMGFSLGADDYIVKPFDPLELRARVESKLRRTDEAKKADQWLWSGNIKLNIAFQKAFKMDIENERELNLSPTEFRLFYYFINHESHVLSREQLLQGVWGDSVHVIDRTVDTHVCTLRRKLDSHAHHIDSVFGEGYRFTLRREALDLEQSL